LSPIYRIVAFCDLHQPIPGLGMGVRRTSVDPWRFAYCRSYIDGSAVQEPLEEPFGYFPPMLPCRLMHLTRLGLGGILPWLGGPWLIPIRILI
jgi:hypothetical protein